MPIKAFLSSTRSDLDPDCRPAALDGIHHGGATAVAMETWVVTYGDPVQICREKLKSDSTHYVGVFAYRYGSRVPDNSMSITEAEFSFARDTFDSRRVAVFVPDPKCSFAAVLLERARDQTPEEDKAQRAFLEAIRRSGTHTSFTASHDLYQRVKTMVEQWNEGPLRQTRVVAAAHDQPEEADICKLGRDAQQKEFEASYALLAAKSGPEVAAFVIQGSPGMGHREMTTRLRNSFEQSTHNTVMEYAASVSPVWRGEGLRALLSVLGRALRPGFSPISVDEYATVLIERLKTSHVILTIHDVQRFANSIKGLQSAFWSPLARRVAAEASNSLICFIGVESAVPMTGVRAPLTDESIDAWPYDAMIGLTPLQRFTRIEIIVWLRRWMSKESAAQTAETLIAETDGEPRLIYTQFRDPGFWNSYSVFD
ncbi:MAG: DUF4062 domain-containing protein [Bryobacteraceae bacterium]